tara:strand:- start:52 stop:594 length:543 start_codon:yes stop_codon:yes gene_type:complete
MTEIYLAISKLSDKFRTMAYGLNPDENEVNEAVQELMLYFLQMNPETLTNIWEDDKEKGIIRYGAVALRRSLTSPRSTFYYKYKKYYRHIDSSAMLEGAFASKNLYNLPNEIVNDYQWTSLERIDEALDKMNWYDKKVFELYYYESNTLDSLASKTKISRGSLFTTIDKVRNILKDELNE